MYVGLNEASLHGQFGEDILPSLFMFFLQCREGVRRYDGQLRCRRDILKRPLIGQQTLGDLLNRLPNADSRKRKLLGWFNMEGPFIDDELLHNIGMTFECAGQIVTDGMLAELAHRQHYIPGASIASVSAIPSAMGHSPLRVICGDASPAVAVDVPNHVAVDMLEAWLRTVQRPIRSWVELAERVPRECTNLFVAEGAFNALGPTPFNPLVAESLLERIRVLNRLKSCFDENGQWNAAGLELRQMHFMGDKAWFSGGGDVFFPHPEHAGEKLACPWHGKVKTPQLRIHYSEPITKDDPLYVVYVGPKLLKW